MKPCTLSRISAINVCNTFIAGVRQLHLVKDRNKVVKALVWLAKDGYPCLSLVVLQKELHWHIGVRIKSRIQGGIRKESPVLLACMLALCWHVDAEPVYGCTPWDVHKEICQGILYILNEYQQQVSVAGGQSPISDETVKAVAKCGTEPEEGRGVEEGEKGHVAVWNNTKKGAAARTEKKQRRGKKMAPLHTKSFLTFGVSFLDGDFIPQLVEKMPRLQHISIIIRESVRGALDRVVIDSLAHHCKQLEYLDVDLRREEDYDDNFLFNSVFGADKGQNTKNMMKKLCQGEDLKKLEPQLQNLRVFNWRMEHYYSSVHLIWYDDDQLMFTLLHQPKLEYMQRRTCCLTFDHMKTLCEAWTTVHGHDSGPPVLPLKHFAFSPLLCRDLLQQPGDPHNMMSLFDNVTSVDLTFKCLGQGNEESSDMMKTVIDHFDFNRVTSLMVLTFSIPAVPKLALLQHLKVDYSDYSTIHTILSHCLNLSTLSIDTCIRPRNENSTESDKEWMLQHTGTHREHSKLATLHIGFSSASRSETLETFITSCLGRLPNLEHLCLVWSGVPDEGGSVGKALEMVVKQTALSDSPILTQLQMLCCLPRKYGEGGGDYRQYIRSYLRMAKFLPCLQYITPPLPLPSVELPKVYFKMLLKNSNLEFSTRCTAEQAFYIHGTHKFR